MLDSSMFNFLHQLKWFFSFIEIIAKPFSHHSVNYWVISNMKDMFSFFFFWLNVWSISFFYKQSVTFIIRRLHIILKTLLDLNGFIISIHATSFWKKVKTNSVKWLVSKRIGIHVSCPQFEQIKILWNSVHVFKQEDFLRLCWSWEWEGFTILMLSSLYTFYS